MNTSDSGDRFNRMVIDKVIEKFRKRAANQGCEAHLQLLRRKWIDQYRKVCESQQEIEMPRLPKATSQLMPHVHPRQDYTAFVAIHPNMALMRRPSPFGHKMIYYSVPHYRVPEEQQHHVRPRLQVNQAPQYRLLAASPQLKQQESTENQKAQKKPDGNEVLKHGLEMLEKQSQAPLIIKEKGKQKSSQAKEQAQKSGKHSDKQKEAAPDQEEKKEEMIDSEENFSDESDDEAAFEQLDLQREDTNGWKGNEVKKEEENQPKLLSVSESKEMEGGTANENQTAAELVNSLVANGTDAKRELEEEKKEQESSESEVNELEECSDIEIEEFEADDTLVGLFQEVKRTTVKYKCVFINCILHIRGRDIIVPKMTADIDY